MDDKAALREVIRVLAMLCHSKSWKGTAHKLESILDSLIEEDKKSDTLPDQV